MADAAFAAGAQRATPISRSEPVSARRSNTSSAQTADFGRDLSADRSESANAALSLLPNQERSVQPGSGLLSTGTLFLLAETRTQEASAPLPPVSNFERARNQYLSTQSQIRDTIAANSLLRGPGASSSGASTAPAATNEQPRPVASYSDAQGGNDIEEAEAPRPRIQPGSLI